MARGRKRTQPRYFDTAQEEAILLYLQCENDTEQRNLIYDTYLKDAFNKMVESIINRYNLHSHEMSFSELMQDTISFLHTKLSKFKPEKNFKAYSYFGTIIKHRLMGERMKEQKKMSNHLSFEDKSELIIQDERNSYEIDVDESATKEFFYEYIEILDTILVANEDEECNLLKPNEEKLGYAIVSVMKNWENIFEENSGVKYTKNIILECLRNMTGLSTKDIRDNLKIFRKIYFERKKIKLNNEFNE